MRIATIAIMACLVMGSGTESLPAQTLVVAHRGLLRRAPENTLANFRACLELRLGFEVDVRRSKDGHLVCVHDGTVNRTTDGSGAVGRLTLHEMKKLDAGGWFSPAFRGERIPTWEEVLAEVAKHPESNVLIAVDLKAANIEADTVKAAKSHHVLDRLLFIGTTIRDAGIRRKLRTADAKAHVACLANTPAGFPMALKDEESDWVYFRYVPSAKEIGRVHAAKKRAFIAGPTVAGRTPANWKKAADAGMDAILTDYSLDLAQQLRVQTTESAGTNSSKGTPMDEKFQQLSKRFLDEFPALSPIGATLIGDHRFDNLLDDVSDESRRREREFCRAYMKRLDEMDPSQLSRNNQVDYVLLRNELDKWLWQLDTLQEWAWNPVKYTQLAGGSVYSLMAREFAPIEQRLVAAAARLGQLPRFYRQVRATLEPKRVPAVHAETAIKQNRGVQSIIDNMIRPHRDRLTGADRKNLDNAVETATDAVEQQQKWLEKELLPNAGGDFRLGPRLYDKKLSLILGTTMTRQQIRNRAESELKRVRAEMYDIARPIYLKKHANEKLPDDPDRQLQQRVIESVLELAYAEMPSRDGVVRAAKRSLEIAIKFIKSKDLISVPADPLDIIIMPEFKRGVSFAYCDSPGPLEVGLKTYYAVAPLPKNWNDEQSRSFLREYNIRSVHNLTIHEAMPGHFLQLAFSNRYPSKLRAVLSSGVFVEGWACYTEQMMSEEGFLDRDPLMRLITLKWYLRSIANAMLDQAIHVDGMRRPEAMKLMMEDTFQEEREAAAKWTRARLTSTQLSTYFVGYQEHREIRRAAEKEWGNAFTLKRYHDTVISYGSPPPHFVRALLLNQKIDVANQED